MSTPDQEYQYIERDLSWLSFNERVLQEAKDPSVPLFERLKFLAIYSSNLDEFFRVRVASMRRFKELNKETRRDMEIRPKKILKQVRKIVSGQQEEFGRIFREEILPELAENRIYLINNEHYTREQRAFARQYFEENIRVLFSMLFVGEKVTAPFLKNRGLYFAVRLSGGEYQWVIVEIPSDHLPRFLVFPGPEDKHFIGFLDDIIRFHLPEMLPGYHIEAIASIKVSRDAEMYIDDEYTGDLLEKIKQGLEQRKTGLPTRFLYDAAMPPGFLSELKTLFSLKKDDIIPGARYHNFNDFFSFPNPENNSEFHDPPLPPLEHPTLHHAHSLITAIAEKDHILHFPYQQFGYLTRLLEEAAEDPEVKAIKITLYRIASDSKVAHALLRALKNGKKVLVFVEAKARFDEEINLDWGKRLSDSGATVLYSYPGIKVHTKLMLFQREENGKLVNYAYLGTGNFNEKTAGLYCDHGLLTSDARLSDDVDQVFELLARKVIIPKTRHLLVSPFTTRDRFEALIDAEIERGEQGYILAKMNSLEDKGMITRLYEASQAGVEVRLIVRGIFCLQMGQEGITDHIYGTSIIDRFLEHARIYIFGNGGNERMYLASADWMSRNLDRRVEAVFPIYQEDIRKELRHIIDLQINDNTKARILNANLDNSYVKTGETTPTVRAQTDTYQYLQSLLKG